MYFDPYDWSSAKEPPATDVAVEQQHPADPASQDDPLAKIKQEMAKKGVFLEELDISQLVEGQAVELTPEQQRQLAKMLGGLLSTEYIEKNGDGIPQITFGVGSDVDFELNDPGDLTIWFQSEHKDHPRNIGAVFPYAVKWMPQLLPQASGAAFQLREGDSRFLFRIEAFGERSLDEVEQALLQGLKEKRRGEAPRADGTQVLPGTEIQARHYTRSGFDLAYGNFHLPNKNVQQQFFLARVPIHEDGTLETVVFEYAHLVGSPELCYEQWCEIMAGLHYTSQP